jgi:A/G-specific adenine glycosylase
VGPPHRASPHQPLDSQRIGGVERRDATAHITSHRLSSCLDETVHEALGSLEKGPVALEFVGHRPRTAGGLECPQAQLVGPAEMPAGELRVTLLQRDRPKLHVGFQKIRAFRKQPHKLVAGDLRLAGGKHRLHLLEILATPAGAPRLNDLPFHPPRALSPREREPVAARTTAGRAAGRRLGHGGIRSGVTHREIASRTGRGFLAPQGCGTVAGVPRLLTGCRDRRGETDFGTDPRLVCKGRPVKHDPQPPSADGFATGPAPARVVTPLLRWYARHARDLPWRTGTDPYRVWVSEIMLQQTQVERVRDFFTRFLARFPDVQTLARAREREVLELWEGLGYYRRARQLHAAARLLVAEHGGVFPRTVAELVALPGIGRYTAGAIASIAFGVQAPVVEANSRRVFARLVGHDAPLGGGAGDGPIWEVAARLVPRRDPGRFNQAIMDLGSLVCTPTHPRCHACPLASVCVAHGTGRTASIPRAAARPSTRRLEETAVVVRGSGGRVLVVRRGAGEWWEGLWDFPRSARPPRQGRTLGVVAYSVTRHRVTCSVVERGARPREQADVSAGRRWVTPAALARIPLAAPARRIAALLAGQGPGRVARRS